MTWLITSGTVFIGTLELTETAYQKATENRKTAVTRNAAHKISAGMFGWNDSSVVSLAAAWDLHE